jgi:Rrf2 family protein
MAVSTQFSIAVHLMAGLGSYPGADLTSTQLATSVNACPSFVRRVLAKLSKANLVHTTTGKSGFCSLARKPQDISLLDIYKAVEAPKAFSIHDYPAQQACQVSSNIKSSLHKVLDRTQKAMEESLSNTSLAEIISDVKRV